MVLCPWGKGVPAGCRRVHVPSWGPQLCMFVAPCLLAGSRAPGTGRSHEFVCVWGHVPVFRESSACSHKVNARTQSPAPNAS